MSEQTPRVRAALNATSTQFITVDLATGRPRVGGAR